MLALFLFTTTCVEAAERPNIVFIFSDDHAYQAISAYGSGLNKTPSIDRIGAEGMYFKNAFCTNALCGPTRVTVLTGMYSRSTGALSNENLDKPLPPDIPYFTDLLRQAGYDTAIVGKVHMPMGAEDRPWDYYFGHNDPSNNYANPLFNVAVTFMEVFPVGLIVTLISAAILRRNPRRDAPAEAVTA